MATQERLRRVTNAHYITVSQESLSGDSSEPILARELIAAVLDSPKPPADEWGISPFRELWVLFTPEGSESRQLQEEEPDGHSTWLNAFSLIRPSDSFLQGYQKELESHLKYLFAGDELIEQKRDLLYRITAS